MKISFYMEDGLEQIVLTPINESEQKLLDRLHSEDRDLSVYRGSFFERHIVLRVPNGVCSGRGR